MVRLRCGNSDIGLYEGRAANNDKLNAMLQSACLLYLRFDLVVEHGCSLLEGMVNLIFRDYQLDDGQWLRNMAKTSGTNPCRANAHRNFPYSPRLYSLLGNI